MIPVCTADESRALDHALIETVGVPGIALMDQASRGLAEVVRDRFGAEARQGVTVVCGPGNNGGDGYAAARWLKGWGFDVKVWSLAEESKGDAAVMRRACMAAGVPEVDKIGRPGVIVDAVFGTGLDRDVTGRWATVLLRMDTHPSPVVAADLPSGIHTDTGMVLGTAVHAAHTVTFGRHKRGLFTPGASLAGEVTRIDIGLDAVPDVVPTAVWVPPGAALGELWPRRTAVGHKRASGHLLVVAGSAAMAGAAALTCEGALAAGAGLVTLLAPRGARSRMASLAPEVMWIEAGTGSVVELGRVPDLDRYSAIAVGPGLGGGQPFPPHTEMALSALWQSVSVPAVYDADALGVRLPRPAAERVVTPHPGEAARMCGVTSSDIEADRFGAVARLVGPSVTALLKGQHTLVAAEGRPISINGTGSPALSTAGSGDVLTGVIGALLARGVAGYDAARLGAYVHGLAGDLLAARRSEGWRAGDIARTVPQAIEQVLST